MTSLQRICIRALLKYTVVLASGVAIGLYVHGTIRLEQVAMLPRVDEINIFISNKLAHLRPETTVILDDPTDERRVDEDLDYLIAKRTGTLEGWQAFSAAHAAGAHADSAEAEMDKLSLLVKTTHPAAAQISDRVSPEAKVESDIAGASRPLAPRNPPSNEITHPTSELTPGKLRPQVTDPSDGSDTVPTSPIPPAKKAGPARGEKPRATAFHREATISSHVVPVHHQHPCTVRFLCHWKTPPLPPILMALLGVKTKHSRGAIGQAFAEARPGDLRGR